MLTRRGSEPKQADSDPMPWDGNLLFSQASPPADDSMYRLTVWNLANCNRQRTASVEKVPVFQGVDQETLGSIPVNKSSSVSRFDFFSSDLTIASSERREKRQLR